MNALSPTLQKISFDWLVTPASEVESVDACLLELCLQHLERVMVKLLTKHLGSSKLFPTVPSSSLPLLWNQTTYGSMSIGLLCTCPPLFLGTPSFSAWQNSIYLSNQLISHSVQERDSLFPQNNMYMIAFP